MPKKNIIVGIIFLAVIIGLFAWGKLASPSRPKIAAWRSAGVECLTNGHQNLSQHIHVQLHIIVDGEEESVPSNIGMLPDCLAEIHVHDGEANVIHIETTEPSKQFTLKDFFAVWGEPLEKVEYQKMLFVNSATSTEDGNLVLKDKQVIELKYTKSPAP